MWWLVWGSDGSLEASQLALCPARTESGLVLCNQMFMLLRLWVSGGIFFGTAKLGLPPWTLPPSVR